MYMKNNWKKKMLNISLKFPVLSKFNNLDSDIEIDFCDFSK